MMRLFLLWVFVMGFSKSIGQNFQIKGFVTDDKGNKVQNVTVVLLHDSLRRAVTTNSSGVFEFKNVRLGYYLLTASHVGFRTVHEIPLKVDRDLLALNLFLLDSIKENEIIKVKAHKQLIKIEGDHVIYDPTTLPGLNSENVLELLKKLPGFWLDADNKIHVNGNGSVTVLINGVRQSMGTNQVISLLKGLPSSAVSRIVATTGGSYKYDASSGTLVDIQLRKRANAGLDLTLTNGVTVNKYLSNRHQLYGAFATGSLTMNTSITYSKDYNYYDKKGKILYPSNGGNNQIASDQVAVPYFGNGHGQTASVSGIHNMSWNITKQNSLLLNLAANFTRGASFAQELRSFTSPLTYTNIFRQKRFTKDRMFTIDMGFKHRLDTIGSILSFNYGWLSGNMDPVLRFNNKLNFTSEEESDPVPVFMWGENAFNGYQHIFKLDLSKHVNKNWSFNAGA